MPRSTAVSTRITSATLRKGVQLEDGSITMPAEVQFLPGESKHSWVAVTIHEGKYHQVHRMFEALGFRVDKLQRVAFANLTFHHLRVGDARELTQLELNQLRDAVGLDHSAVARGRWRSDREETDIPRRARAKARAEAEADAPPGTMEGRDDDELDPDEDLAPSDTHDRARPSAERGRGGVSYTGRGTGAGGPRSFGRGASSDGPSQTGGKRTYATRGSFGRGEGTSDRVHVGQARAMDAIAVAGTTWDRSDRARRVTLDRVATSDRGPRGRQRSWTAVCDQASDRVIVDRAIVDRARAVIVELRGTGAGRATGGPYGACEPCAVSDRGPRGTSDRRSHVIDRVTVG